MIHGSRHDELTNNGSIVLAEFNNSRIFPTDRWMLTWKIHSIYLMAGHGVVNVTQTAVR